MNWLAQNSSALNVLINLGVLMTWIIYLQVFLVTYLRGRRPRIIINRSKGTDIDAICLVSNMSQEPVYAQSVVCTIEHDAGSCTATVTDRGALHDPTEDDRPEGVTSHGPLNRGDFMSIGTFRNMLELAAREAEDCPDGLDALADSIRAVEITVIGAFGGDDLEVAARRRYRIDRDATPWQVTPETVQTRQVSSRRERREIRRWLERELPGAI